MFSCRLSWICIARHTPFAVMVSAHLTLLLPDVEDKNWLCFHNHRLIKVFSIYRTEAQFWYLNHFITFQALIGVLFLIWFFLAEPSLHPALHSSSSAKAAFFFFFLVMTRMWIPVFCNEENFPIFNIVWMWCLVSQTQRSVFTPPPMCDSAELSWCAEKH